MTIRKTSLDNSVGYVIKNNHSYSEQSLPISKERDSESNTRKENASNNKLSQNDEKLINNITI